jgi:hypothetical protein
MTPTEIRNRAACPVCKALLGQPCFGVRGRYRRGNHRERADAARRNVTRRANCVVCGESFPLTDDNLIQQTCDNCEDPPPLNIEKIKADLARAVKVRDQRNAALDELNTQLRRVEEVLREHHGGQAAAIELDGKTALLWWCGLWALDRDGKRKPLLKASKEIRTAAAEILPDLWNQLQYEEEPDGQEDSDSAR